MRERERERERELCLVDDNKTVLKSGAEEMLRELEAVSNNIDKRLNGRV